MIRAIAIAAGMLLGLGCTGNKVTEIVIAVATDLKVPDELDQLTVQAHYVKDAQSPKVLEKQLLAVSYTWDLTSTDLPATIGLLPGSDPTRLVVVTVDGLLQGNPVVRRQAMLPFAVGRTLLIHMNLLRRCKAVNCGQLTTCTEDDCQNLEQDLSKLSDYTPTGASRVFLDARAVVDQGRVLADGPSHDQPIDKPPTALDGVRIEKPTGFDPARVDARPSDGSRDGPATDKAKALDQPQLQKDLPKWPDKPKSPDAFLFDMPKPDLAKPDQPTKDLPTTKDLKDLPTTKDLKDLPTTKDLKDLPTTKDLKDLTTKT